MAAYRIIIIDDDDDARHLLGMALEGRYEVVEASDGLDALSKLELFEPDFAIIDIMMPLMDGYQVCEAIRRHPSFGVMQVLFLSAHGTKEHIKKSYEVGANLFMTKPVDPERVLKNIDFTIQHESPPLRHKRYTIEQLRQLESEGRLKAEAERLNKPKREAQSEASESPVAPRPVPPAPVAPPPAPEPAAETIIPRILAVDDDDELLKMLRLALSESYEVTTAANGLEAIERMVDYEPDLMLLDIMMPKMNGYQLLQSIRRNAFYRSLPVLVLSAKSSPKDREYAARLGATHFLAKPYKIAELLELIEAETHAPDFAPRPKRLTLFDIGEREYREQREKDDRRERMERQDQIHGIQDILDQDSGRK